MKQITLCAMAFSMLAGLGLNAQTLEKTHELSGKSKRGNITDLVYDAEKETIELRYMYNTTVNGTAIFEGFKYDKNFEQIDNYKQEGKPIDLAKKNKASNYKGDHFVKKGVKMGYNLSMKLELAVIQTETEYTYNWDINQYDVDVREANRSTIAPDDAAGYLGHSGIEDLHNGGGLFVTALRDKMFGKNIDRYLSYKKFRFIKMDNDLNKVKESKLDFDQYHEIVITKPLYDTSDDPDMPKLAGIACVFAPVYLKKFTTKPADEWLFVFIDAQGNIAKKIDFKVPTTKWDAADIVYNPENDEIYVYGPANNSTNKKGVMKYYNNLTMQTTTTTTGEKKYKQYQVMKVQGDKVAYVTNESLDEMALKTWTMKGPSKKRIYKGRKFMPLGVNYMGNGDFMIYGTNWGSRDSNGVIHNYKEAVTIQFDKDGGIKKIYAIKPYEKNYENVPMTNTVINDKSGKYMYWILEENAGIKKSLVTKGSKTKSGGTISYSGGFAWKSKYLLYPRIIQIDLEKNSMSEHIPGNKEYYLDNKFPYIKSKEGEFIFFGADKPGKNIWFNRINFN